LFVCFDPSYTKQKLHKAQIAMDIDFQKKITTIFDYTYSNTAIRLPSQVGIEVGKILHTGLYREEKEKKKIAFEFSPLQIKDIQGGDKALCTSVAKEIRSSYEAMNKDLNLYEDRIKFDDIQLAYIASYLNGINFANKERDYFGDALEVFRSTWAKQAGGQFFTDQRVTTLALQLIEFDPTKGDDLIDLCAGTGGFLLAGFHHIKGIVKAAKGTEKNIIKLASKSLVGFEIDEQISEVGNSTLASRFGGKDGRHIFCANSLDEKKLNQTKKIKFGSHLCAATNPPFGAKIQVRDTNILNEYELARLKGSSVEKTTRSNEPSSRSPDILFIEQNIKLLKPGEGRLAIVMPYQLLSGAQATYIRYWIILNCEITAVIDLPSETFQPHTGTKTSLVVLRRRKKSLLSIADYEDSEIFMATPRWIGHDRRGNPTFERSPDGMFTNNILTDFPEIAQAFEAFKKGLSLKNYSEAYSINSKEILKDKHLRINAMFYRQRDKASLISDVQHQNKDWKSVKLGSVVKKIFYPGRFKRNYVDKFPGAIPFLGGSNITELITETGKWFRPDDPHINQLKVEAGWILVTRSGSTGIVSMVPPAWDGFAMSEHVIRIIPNDKELSGEYVYAFLKSNLGQLELAKGIFGSVIEEISPESISEINILIPKNKKIFEKIDSGVKDAQKNRDQAIQGDKDAIEFLEQKLIS
jgi:type I restriction enzyme M protein